MTDIPTLRRLREEAFGGTWTYEHWRIDCGYDECEAPGCNKETEGEADGHACGTVLAPDEYPPPDGQVVAQITVPGLSQFADANGRYIAAMHNALPALLNELEQLRAENERLRASAADELERMAERSDARGLDLSPMSPEMSREFSVFSMRLRARAAELRAGEPECITPSGMTGQHGVYIRDINGVTCCMFCRKPMSAAELRGK